jgi:hypothetical protein
MYQSQRTPKGLPNTFPFRSIDSNNLVMIEVCVDGGR